MSSIYEPYLKSMGNIEIASQTKIPDDLQESNLTAFFQQEAGTLLRKHRPASVLLVISMIFQKYFPDKIDKYLLVQKYFSLYLPKYGKVGTILLLENWKKGLVEKDLPDQY